MFKQYNRSLHAAAWRDPDGKFRDHFLIMYGSKNIFMFFAIYEVLSKSDLIDWLIDIWRLVCS